MSTNGFNLDDYKMSFSFHDYYGGKVTVEYDFLFTIDAIHEDYALVELHRVDGLDLEIARVIALETQRPRLLAFFRDHVEKDIRECFRQFLHDARLYAASGVGGAPGARLVDDPEKTFIDREFVKARKKRTRLVAPAHRPLRSVKEDETAIVLSAMNSLRSDNITKAAVCRKIYNSAEPWAISKLDRELRRANIKWTEWKRLRKNNRLTPR